MCDDKVSDSTPSTATCLRPSLPLIFSDYGYSPSLASDSELGLGYRAG